MTANELEDCDIGRVQFPIPELNDYTEILEGDEENEYEETRQVETNTPASEPSVSKLRRDDYDDSVEQKKSTTETCLQTRPCSQQTPSGTKLPDHLFREST
ncbi:hypothetical protein AgCh_012752 [Apium graveolens]